MPCRQQAGQHAGGHLSSKSMTSGSPWRHLLAPAAIVVVVPEHGLVSKQVCGHTAVPLPAGPDSVLHEPQLPTTAHICEHPCLAGGAAAADAGGPSEHDDAGLRLPQPSLIADSRTGPALTPLALLCSRVLLPPAAQQLKEAGCLAAHITAHQLRDACCSIAHCQHSNVVGLCMQQPF